jgi:hypothetical protein
VPFLWLQIIAGKTCVKNFTITVVFEPLPHAHAKKRFVAA